MTALRVRATAGPVLVQDAGRPGLAALGVGAAGAADRASYGLVNRLLGNAAGAAALEVVLGGLEVEATGTCWVCVTGAPVPLTVDGRAEPSGAVLALRPGQRLRLGPPANGVRSYLGVRGGLRVAPVLGSASWDTLASLGPSPIRAGDLLEVGAGTDGPLLVDAVPPAEFAGPAVLDVVRGPREDWFADPRVLVASGWTVQADSDRVGVRLDGPRLTRTAAAELPSEGALRGAIQVPPSGRPVVLGADHPVTGGYPVIGVVRDRDTDRLAQLRPGESVRFRWADS
ncbi:5-oxoprolinase subunit C family protein [Nocardioides sambongensis]|uniref:5-oxoprolinase subunit C family protein n=1 Tax=Nocardioides sambongensis TaxID=2589074 RepID=UPI0018C87B9C|nr:biotin-dependent carboxyltransferase family protein [Nocardioides sambongensis]